MREIVLDTETTGLDPRPPERGGTGDRIVEIACLELINHVPTGSEFQRYINPERPMSADAFAVHGLSDEFLADKPLFADIADDLLDFLGDSRLVIHNAEFDLRFINAELERLQRPALKSEAVDTVQLARKKFPGARASLDELCKRFEIDLAVRAKHGALVDVTLLAQVYLELIGGRQTGLALAGLETTGHQRLTDGATAPRAVRAPRPMPLDHGPSAAELEAHAKLIARLKQPVWLKS
jgi:DNA polymerase-3 subunit epsilon